MGIGGFGGIGGGEVGANLREFSWRNEEKINCRLTELVAGAMQRNAVQDLRLRNKVKALLDLSKVKFSKKLQKACNKLIKEFPNDHLVKATISFVYAKYEQFSEAATLLEGSVEDVGAWIDDSGVVYYYSTVMKEMNRNDLLEGVWTEAIRFFARDRNRQLEMKENLFGVLARSGSYARQANLSLDMYKSTHRDIYLLWNVVSRVQEDLIPDLPSYSTISQSVSGTPSGEKMSLTIATKILERFLSEGKLTSHYQTDFLLSLYVQQGRYSDAINMLQSPNSIAIYPLPRKRLQEIAALHHLNGDHSKAAEMFLELIHTCDHDEWSWYIGYMNSALHRSNSDPDSWNEVKNALNSMQDKYQSTRAPLLALCEFEKRICHLDGKTFDTRHLLQFIKRFIDKPSCFHDVRPYLSLIEDPNDFAQRLSNLDDQDFKRNLSVHSHFICIRDWILYTLKIPHTTPSPPIATQTISHDDNGQWAIPQKVVELWERYKEVSAHNEEEKDRIWGDNLLLLSARYLLDDYAVTRNAKSVYLGVFILEHGLSASPSNFQFRLFLSEFYAILNASKPAIEQMEEMGVKSVQLESLCYFYLNAAIGLSDWKNLRNLIKKCLIFYSENAQCSYDWIIDAYRKGTFRKVKEISEFYTSIEKSRNRVSTQLHNVFLQIYETAINVNDLDKVEVALGNFFNLPPFDSLAEKALKNNYDLSVVDVWDLGNENNMRFQPEALSSAYPHPLQIQRLQFEWVHLKLLLNFIDKTPLDENWDDVVNTLEDSFRLFDSTHAASSLESVANGIILSIAKLVRTPVIDDVSLINDVSLIDDVSKLKGYVKSTDFFAPNSLASATFIARHLFLIGKYIACRPRGAEITDLTAGVLDVVGALTEMIARNGSVMTEEDFVGLIGPFARPPRNFVSVLLGGVSYSIKDTCNNIKALLDRVKRSLEKLAVQAALHKVD